jgi:hypothetical protein
MRKNFKFNLGDIVTHKTAFNSFKKRLIVARMQEESFGGTSENYIASDEFGNRTSYNVNELELAK